MDALLLGEHFQVAGEAHEGKEVHGLDGGEQVGVAQGTVGASDAVEKGVRVFFEQPEPGVLLLFDDAVEPALEVGEDLPLVGAEGVLVGDLENAARGIGTLSEPAADDQAVLPDGADDLFHFLREDESGQMEHGGGAQAGAEVGRAGGEEAELGGKGDFEIFFQGGVDLVGLFPSGLEVETAAHDLDAEVILFVDHDGAGLVAADDDGPVGALGEFFADEVALDEEGFFRWSEIGHAVAVGVFQLGERLEGGQTAFLDLATLGGLSPAGEGKTGQIAGEANAGAEHDGLLRADVVHQVVFSGEKGVENHGK